MSEMDLRIARINELYHKSKEPGGLTKEELEEQKQLRQEYILSIRANLRGQLNQIQIQEEDGSITDLGEKHMTKSELRKEYLGKRDEISVKQIKELSSAICDRFVESKEYKNAESILTYVSIQSEVDTENMISVALRDKKKVYCPRIEHGEMNFYRITSFEDLVKGYKGIPEPNSDTKAFPMESENTAVVVVPGCVFDKEGYRIGYGKGFYDNFFARKSFQGRKVGFTYEMQVVRNFIHEPKDVPVDALCTEQNLYYL